MEKRNPGENTPALTRGLANDAVDKEYRYKQILDILKSCPMTAKEVAVEMHRRGQIPTDERNFSAPRLTELCEKGLVEPVGRKTCAYSRRKVTVYGLRSE